MAKVTRVEKKMRKKRIKITLLLLLLIFALFLFISLKTDFFNIVYIQVLGNNKTPKDTIIKASGIIKNENIFKLNIKSKQKSIKSLPYIKEAEIKRRLPNKIVISVVEREEKLEMVYLDSFIYLDEEGYILSIEDEKKEGFFPELKGLKVDKPKLGGNLFNSYEGLKKFIISSDEVNVLKDFDKIDIKDKNNAIIELKIGTKVAFGDFNNIKYKLSFLNSILKDIDEKKLTCKYIYLNKGQNPIIVTETD